MDYTSPPSEESRQKFKSTILTMLRSAIKVELSTIPLYLYSIYSIIKDDGKGGTQARAKISVVVHQEMLHLALAGNLLTSIDSGPHLYSAASLPTYGGPDDVILYSKIPLRLERCEKSNLECFLRIEAPYLAPSKLTAEEESANTGVHDRVHPVLGALDKFNSIGEFYSELEDMIKKSAEYITFKNKDLQFSPTDFFSDKMTQVTDQKSAHHALKIIIDQGEGSVGVEEAHYQMFLELYMKRTEWTCQPVPNSPKTETYKENKLVYELALAFNASYCYLLVTIQKTWQVSDLLFRRGLIGNIHSIMIDVMTPLAEFMVNEPFQDGKAAPPFEFYDVQAEDPSKVDEAARKLWAAIQLHLGNAINEVQDAEKKEVLNVIKFSAERIMWPMPRLGHSSV
ncbi:ferritin-like-domain-containing protein [Suillus clintonianus]|uniref:ferritin-like-domain-containing protein n=1 Tax=Suillus clintonianus TaxID=1904413 RepID=UPI001B87213C|nr:ferritin-like-domain-containing protein [Suillus clintonianus]KAG2110790.1 ferritin-like-domain-containing protein [Suillus clintonianus]